MLKEKYPDANAFVSTFAVDDAMIDNLAKAGEQEGVKKGRRAIRHFERIASRHTESRDCKRLVQYKHLLSSNQQAQRHFPRSAENNQRRAALRSDTQTRKCRRAIAGETMKAIRKIIITACFLLLSTATAFADYPAFRGETLRYDIIYHWGIVWKHAGSATPLHPSNRQQIRSGTHGTVAFMGRQIVSSARHFKLHHIHAQRPVAAAALSQGIPRRQIQWHRHCGIFILAKA